MRKPAYGPIVLFSAVVAAVAWGWSSRERSPAARSPGVEARAAAAPSSPPSAAASTSEPRLFVLAINGGGSPRENYLSHLQHLQGLVDLLRDAGVPAERIAVLAGDGGDPAADLALRVEAIGSDYWRLRGSAMEGKLLPRLELGSSAVTGATLYPATRGSLSVWTLTVGQQLRAGDTLLLYVTDHGTLGATPEENRIVLWGAGQGLSVRELRDTLESLDPEVRVVALMSQCYSGAFASLLSLGAAEGEATGRFCGYFSASAKDKSYGCYPETRDALRVGHSFMFLQALSATAGRFALAHELVVERDDTPDQPLRTSDVFAGAVLEREARARQLSRRQLVEELLRSAWARPGVFAGQAQHLDRLAARFGFASPRGHAAVDELDHRLQEWQARLGEAITRVGRTLEDLNREALRRFLRARPSWQPSLKPGAVKAMDAKQRMQLGATLVAELAAAARADDGGLMQAAAKEMLDAAEALRFRLTVRQAALERARLVLDRVAAAEHLAEAPDERASLARLLACEELTLPIPERAWPEPPPLPGLADDLAQAEMILALTSVDESATPSALRVGEPLPELELVAYRGQLPLLGNGRPLVLFFWATWCKPCKAVLPELLATAAKRSLDVLAITSESEADIARFFATAPEFPSLVARDPEARASSLLGLRAIPAFLLLDGQGRARGPIVHSPRELPEMAAE